MRHQRSKFSNQLRTRSGAIMIVCSLLVFPVLAAQADPGNDRLVLRKQGVESTGGPFSITASCQDGEIRLGGGYKLSHPELNADDALSVEGNYPSGSRDWTVSGSHDSPSGTARYVSAEAYCIQSTGASAQTISSSIIRSQPDGDGRFFRAESQAVCPGATILTGGGFRTSATKAHSGIYNAWLSSFLPVQNASGEARGWRAAIDAIQWDEPPSRPTLQTFAVCTNPNIGTDQIKSGSVISGNIPSRTDFGYSSLGPRTLQCPAGEIALSGGYNFGDSTGHADLFVPHQIIESHSYSRPRIIQREIPSKTRPSTTTPKANPRKTGSSPTKAAKSASPLRASKPILAKPQSIGTTPAGDVAGPDTQGSNPGHPTKSYKDDLVIGPSGDVISHDTNPFVDFGGWTVSGIFGSQSASQTLTGFATCFKLPKVRFTVEILTPEDGFSIGPDLSASGNGTTTPPVSMTAIAAGANGQAVANATYTWIVDGVTVGTGASLSRPIATQACGVDYQTVKVVARDDSGRVASDEVAILVGQVC
jgi:hypothetical protein